MSQYPSPYWPPPGQATYPGFNPYAALLAPARRAGIMMFVLGGLALLWGSCAGVFSLTDLSRLPAEQQAQFQARIAQWSAANPGVSLQRWTGERAIASVAIGLPLVLLGFFVRRGGRRSLITGLCLAIPLVLLLSLEIVLGLLDGGQVAIGAVVALMPLAVLLRWLVQAMRNGKQLHLAQSQSQMQYGQYQQNAQAYAQPPAPGYTGYGGGYGVGPPGFVPGQGVPGAAPQQQPPPPPPPSERGA